jgi:hypothetical protein
VDFSKNRACLFNKEWTFFQPDISRWTVPLSTILFFVCPSL